MPRDPRLYLDDILDAIAKIQEYSVLSPRFMAKDEKG